MKLPGVISAFMFHILPQIFYFFSSSAISPAVDK